MGIHGSFQVMQGAEQIEVYSTWYRFTWSIPTAANLSLIVFDFTGFRSSGSNRASTH